MIAAFTFNSAEDFTQFCARHRITREDTYSVLQSLVAPIWEGECYPEMRVTLVIDASPAALQAITQREEEHTKAQEEAERERLRLAAEEDARWAEEQKRLHEKLKAAGAELYPDDIPF